MHDSEKTSYPLHTFEIHTEKRDFLCVAKDEDEVESWVATLMESISFYKINQKSS